MSLRQRWSSSPQIGASLSGEHARQPSAWSLHHTRPAGSSGGGWSGQGRLSAWPRHHVGFAAAEEVALRRLRRLRRVRLCLVARGPVGALGEEGEEAEGVHVWERAVWVMARLRLGGGSGPGGPAVAAMVVRRNYTRR